ncbi:MAG: hypothetical protein AAFX78_02405 [Cyanobacteria bacterium J06638_20]
MTQVEEGTNDWLETWSGQQFDPFSFTNEQINVLDVAHALSMICRFGGHTKRFYSVAEHAIILHDYAMQHNFGPRLAYEVLHHDDPEYVLGDKVRPLKGRMPEYERIERVVAMATAAHFHCRFPLPGELKFLDNHIIIDERAAVMNPSANEWHNEHWSPLGVKFWNIRGRSPEIMRRQYLKRHIARCKDLSLEHLIPEKASFARPRRRSQR